jgi:hypothetical protein
MAYTFTNHDDLVSALAKVPDRPAPATFVKAMENGAVVNAQSVGVTKAAVQNIASGAGGTALIFDTQLWDTNALHDNVTNNTRLTAKVAGIYQITGQLVWAASAVGLRALAILLNATYTLAIQTDAAANQTQYTVTTIFPLSANDYVELIAVQTSGGGLNTSVAAYYTPRFQMHMLAPV